MFIIIKVCHRQITCTLTIIVIINAAGRRVDNGIGDIVVRTVSSVFTCSNAHSGVKSAIVDAVALSSRELGLKW